MLIFHSVESLPTPTQLDNGFINICCFNNLNILCQGDNITENSRPSLLLLVWQSGHPAAVPHETVHHLGQKEVELHWHSS